MKSRGCLTFVAMSKSSCRSAVIPPFNRFPQSIPYNPVFFSYAIVTPTTATLYIDESKIDKGVISHLGDTVQIRPYESVFNDSKILGESLRTEIGANGSQAAPKKRFMISTKASWAISLALGGESKVDEVRSPVGDAKAIKNKTELEGMRQCHIRDGAALSEYFAWLEDELVAKGTKMDEVEAADKLEAIRS
jgi:Xaa-Pro aminopeptidase